MHTCLHIIVKATGGDSTDDCIEYHSSLSQSAKNNYSRVAGGRPGEGDHAGVGRLSHERPLCADRIGGEGSADVHLVVHGGALVKF